MKEPVAAALFAASGAATPSMAPLPKRSGCLLTFFSMASFLLLLAEWFDVLRWAGAAYLVYLGARMWLKKPTALDAEATRAASPVRLLVQGFLTNVTNPKLLIFYGAFFPQFVDESTPLRPQLAILCLTFFVIAATFDTCYAFLGGRARVMFRSSAARRSPGTNESTDASSVFVYSCCGR